MKRDNYLEFNLINQYCAHHVNRNYCVALLPRSGPSHLQRMQYIHNGMKCIALFSAGALSECGCGEADGSGDENSKEGFRAVE